MYKQSCRNPGLLEPTIPEEESNACVLVSQLPDGFDRQLLLHRFSAHGEIINSAEILATDNACGHCSIVYRTNLQAEKAVAVKNKNFFGPKRIIVSLLAEIQVSGLSSGYDSEKLIERFSVYGEVLNAEFIRSKKIKDDVCTIRYLTKEIAFSAVISENRAVFEGKSMMVCRSLSKLDEAENKEDLSTLVVRVKRLPKNFDRQKLLDKFQVYGEITNADKILVMNNNKGRVDIKYKTDLEVLTAANKEETCYYVNKLLEVTVEQKTGPSNIMVSGLPPNFSKSKLSDRFNVYGQILNLPQICSMNLTQGVCVFKYKTIKEAAEAVRKEDKTTFENQTISVGLTKAENRDFSQKAKTKDEKTEALNLEDGYAPFPCRTTISIGTLPKTINTKKLIEKFSVYGQVLNSESILLGGDFLHGFWNLEYGTLEEAKKAILEENKSVFENVPISVGLNVKANKESEKESPTSFFVHVSPILERVDKEGLIKRFEEHGKILNHMRIRCEKLDQGFCLIEYAYLNSANYAVQKLHKTIFEDKLMKVCLKPAGQSTTMTSDPQIVVSNLPPDVDRKELIKRFSEFGVILNKKKILKRNFKKGHCFVSYETSDECFNAIRDMNGLFLFGESLTVKFNKQSSFSTTQPGEINSKTPYATPMFRAVEPNRGILVTKLARFWNPDEVLRRFTMHGEIVHSSATMTRSESGRGFVHIEYRTEGQARRALEAENGAMFCGREMKVEMSDKEEQDIITSAPNTIQLPAPVISSKGPKLPNRSEANIVEILCGSKPEMVDFGQFIKGELVAALIPSVGVLQLTPGYSFDQIFDQISKDGVKFACLFATRNISRRTISVKCLSSDETLTDVPVAEAVSFIRKMYLMLRSVMGSRIPSDAFVLPPNIRTIARFIAEGRDMSVVEFDTILRFMVSYRENKLKEVYGTKVPAQLLEPPLQLDKDPVLKDKEKEIQAVLLDVFENPQFPSSGARQSRIQQALVQHTLSGFLQKQVPVPTSALIGFQQNPESRSLGFRSAFKQGSEFRLAFLQDSESRLDFQQGSEFPSRQVSKFRSAFEQDSEAKSTFQQGSESQTTFQTAELRNSTHQKHELSTRRKL